MRPYSVTEVGILRGTGETVASATASSVFFIAVPYGWQERHAPGKAAHENVHSLR